MMQQESLWIVDLFQGVGVQQVYHAEIQMESQPEKILPMNTREQF